MPFVTHGHPKFTWQLGWLSVLVVWIDSKETQIFLQIWSKASAKVRLLGFHGNWMKGILSSLAFTFQLRVILALRSFIRIILGNKAGKKPAFKRMYIQFKKGESPYNYTFSKVNALRKRREVSYFQQGRLNLLILICIYSYSFTITLRVYCNRLNKINSLAIHQQWNVYR